MNNIVIRFDEDAEKFEITKEGEYLAGGDFEYDSYIDDLAHILRKCGVNVKLVDAEWDWEAGEWSRQ